MKHYIADFVEDLNYHKIILNLNELDKDLLCKRLEEDQLNKRWRLADAKYLYVENCDYQGEEIETEEDLKEILEEGYVLYDLKCDESGYYYEN